MLTGPLQGAAGPLQGAAGMERSPPRTLSSESASAPSHPIASLHPLSPPMLTMGALSASELTPSRSEGALYTGVLASQPMRPQEVNFTKPMFPVIFFSANRRSYPTSSSAWPASAA